MNLDSTRNQLGSLWLNLSRRQKFSIVAVAGTVLVGLVAFSGWRSRADFRPLFTGMSAEDAGAVVQKLKESAVEYQVSDNGATVLVPVEKVAETRLQLAAAGLPRTGRIGFELFDQTKLGTTDFAEQVNFRRALEGELERSIRSVAEVAQARVHITPPKDSVFLESKQPAKASVLLQLRDGAEPAPATVTAICHLVASAVEGLAPDQVSVVDGSGNLLSRPKKAQDSGEASDELIQYRQKLEKDLLAKANATLEPLLGAGKYRMGLSIDCDFASGEQSEELYDPEKSVMLTSQKSEESSVAATTAGIPGAASNLPRPAPRGGGAGGGVIRRTENIAYQSSKTVRRLRLPQGNIRRISASLLLDQAVRWDGQGGEMQRVLVPPTAEEVRAIRELVAGAIGMVPSRGDQLVVESLPFASTLHVPAPAPPQPVAAPAAPGPDSQPGVWPVAVPGDWRIWAGGAAAAAVLALAALVFLIRRRRRKPAHKVTKAGEVAAAEKGAALAPAADVAALAGAVAGSELALTAGDELRRFDIEGLSESIRTIVNDDPALAASVLRTWLEENAS